MMGMSMEVVIVEWIPIEPMGNPHASCSRNSAAYMTLEVGPIAFGVGLV